jgi:hypothetical protein
MIRSNARIHLLPLLLFLMMTVRSAHGSGGVRMPVLIRDDQWRPRVVEKTLLYLDGSGGFQGRDFKLVLGKEERPIPLDSVDRDLRLKAATVYHHLTEARHYWNNLPIGSGWIPPQDTLTVRLEITNGFSDLAHFEHDRYRQEYNNALSIPPGQPRPGIGVAPWGPEIWFRPVKVIDTRELPESGLGPGENPITQALEALTAPVRNAAIQRLIQSGLSRIFYPQIQGQTFEQTLIRQAGTLALTSLLLELSRRSDRLFLEKTFYLDTAMIPEIIRHEYAHIALSPRLELLQSTPVIEGFADYFAADQGAHPKLADRIKRYSKSLPKNGRNRRPYDPSLERLLYANSDFVLSVLWQVRETLGLRANRVLLESTRTLDTRESGIRDGLIRAILDSCRIHCENPLRDRMRLRNLFESRGF